MRVPGRGTDWLSRHRCPMGNGPAFLGGPLLPYLWGVEARAKGFVREDVDQSEEGGRSGPRRRLFGPDDPTVVPPSSRARPPGDPSLGGRCAPGWGRSRARGFMSFCERSPTRPSSTATRRAVSVPPAGGSCVFRPPGDHGQTPKTGPRLQRQRKAAHTESAPSFDKRRPGNGRRGVLQGCGPLSLVGAGGRRSLARVSFE
jgi:hypothetical protein